MQSLAFIHNQLSLDAVCEIPNAQGPPDAADQVRRIAAYVQFIFQLK